MRESTQYRLGVAFGLMMIGAPILAVTVQAAYEAIAPTIRSLFPPPEIPPVEAPCLGDGEPGPFALSQSTQCYAGSATPGHEAHS